MEKANIRNEISALVKRLFLERAYVISPKISGNKKFQAYYSEFARSLDNEITIVDFRLGENKDYIGPELSIKYKGHNICVSDFSWERIVKINKYSGNDQLTFGLTTKKNENNSMYSVYQSFGYGDSGGFRISQHTEYKDEMGNCRNVKAIFHLDGEEKLKSFVNIDMMAKKRGDFLRLNCDALVKETDEGLSFKDDMFRSDVLESNAHTYMIVNMKELKHFEEGINTIDLFDPNSIKADVDKGADFDLKQLFEYFADFFNGDVSIYEKIGETPSKKKPVYVKTYVKEGNK